MRGVRSGIEPTIPKNGKMSKEKKLQFINKWLIVKEIFHRINMSYFLVTHYLKFDGHALIRRKKLN